ncbi:hypothetical protein BFS05_05965 [Gardnerella vaginalis]|uniref:Uncharacterized protein n=1 Tax=Gardnerella vaginalis TaxID=2702 RepID=A0A2K1STM2_GARVA|nr:hypothetical protein BFS05_05965 [Gardnerella vaginalis]
MKAHCAFNFEQAHAPNCFRARNAALKQVVALVILIPHRQSHTLAFNASEDVSADPHGIAVRLIWHVKRTVLHN